MSNKVEKEYLEKSLTAVRRSFWVSLVLVILNVIIYMWMKSLNHDSWLPLLVGGFCGANATLQNMAERVILVQLGRKEEI